MNQISTVVRRSGHAVEAHLDLVIDGEPLAQRVEQFLPIDSGLVPCLLPWMDDPAEREVARVRFLPREGAVENAPILMCPDDLDLWCTVVIAEVQHRQDCIYWSRIGLNQSEPDPPEVVGTRVEWSGSFPGWKFSIESYREVFERFRVENSQGI